MILVPLSEIFDVRYGNSLELNSLEQCDENYTDKVSFISRTRENNGISAYVKPIQDVEPFPSGLITVAGSGNSVLESFIQPEPFYTGYHVFILYPKKNLSELEKLFYCFCIRQNQYKYNFGRQANKTLKNLKVPSSVPKEFSDIDINKLTNVTEKSVKEHFKALNTDTWKVFKYGGKKGIFEIKNGYYNKKPDKTEEGNIPFIGASEFNNGVTEYYSLFDIEANHKDERSPAHGLDKKIFQGNCLTVSNNGSVGCAFYQKLDFTCSHDINVLYLKDREWNEYLAMFIAALIELEKYRWAYGRKWRPVRMPDSEIKLPVTGQDKPDWNFMEEFIKSLPYSRSL